MKTNLCSLISLLITLVLHQETPFISKKLFSVITNTNEGRITCLRSDKIVVSAEYLLYKIFYLCSNKFLGHILFHFRFSLIASTVTFICKNIFVKPKHFI